MRIYLLGVPLLMIKREKLFQLGVKLSNRAYSGQYYNFFFALNRQKST
jgi:hypothetical protein